MTQFIDTAGAPAGQRTRSLCRFEDGEEFAYVVRGTEYVRAADHMPWAFQRGEALVSIRSGEPIAYRRGKVYYDVITDEPLLYERAR